LLKGSEDSGTAAIDQRRRGALTERGRRKDKKRRGRRTVERRKGCGF
jgi:hypothetical protein